jgi:hypothetical protein
MESNQPESLEPSSAPAPKGNESVYAAVSLMMGLLSLCSWFITPVCGGASAFAAIALGYLAMKDPAKKTLGIVGMVLGILGLLAACVSGVLSLMGPAIGEVFNQINQSLAP